MATLTPSSVATQISGNFDADWNDAQDKYNSAIRSGFDPADAEQTYLAPVKAKYQIISQSPSLLGNPVALKAFSSEFDDAQGKYQKQYGAYNRDGGDLAASQTLKPLLDKWTIKASLPAGPSQQQREITQGYAEYADGKSAREILKEYPDLALDKSFASLVRADVTRGEKPAPLNDVQKATRDVLSTNLKTALSAGDSTDTEKKQIADAQKALNQFDEKYEPRLMGLTASGPLSPGTGASASVAPSLARPMAPIGPMSGAPTGDSDIPDLTANPAAVAQLPYGAKYSLNGHVYQTFHATPLQAGEGLQVGADRQGTFASPAPSLSPPAAAGPQPAAQSAPAAPVPDQPAPQPSLNRPATLENAGVLGVLGQGAKDLAGGAPTGALPVITGSPVQDVAGFIGSDIGSSLAQKYGPDVVKEISNAVMNNPTVLKGRAIAKGLGVDTGIANIVEGIKSLPTALKAGLLGTSEAGLPLPAAIPAAAAASTPANGAASATPEGATATNPQTGQKMVFQKGQWQPAQT